MFSKKFRIAIQKNICESPFLTWLIYSNHKINNLHNLGIYQCQQKLLQQNKKCLFNNFLIFRNHV